MYICVIIVFSEMPKTVLIDYCCAYSVLKKGGPDPVCTKDILKLKLL